MKNKIGVISLIILTIVAIATTSLGFSVDMTLSKSENIKINDEITVTLNFSEEIVGATFKVNYDNNNLKLVGSETTNLTVSENDGKVAGVYVDMAKTGTNNLKIKFKVINTTNTTMAFKIEDGKFVTKKDEKSYSINKVTKTDETTDNKKDDNTNSNTNKNNITNSTTNNTTSNTTNNTTNNITNNTTNNTISNETTNTDNNTLNTINDVTNTSTNTNSTNNENNNTNSNTSTNTISTDVTTSTKQIPHTGNYTILYIAIALAIVLSVYTGLKIKSKQFEDKYDK